MRIALAQVNATVGDLAGNADLIVDWTRRAAGQGARLVVFPEMMLTGYPVEDLALRASFVEASIAALDATAERLAAEGLGGVAVVTGYLDRVTGMRPRVGLPAGAPLDAAALLYDGAVAVRSAKHHLPNYGVFDEYRYFVPGDVLPVVRLQADDGGLVDVAIAICEDLWQDGGPVAVCRAAGAGLLVVPNASPYERGKDDTRLELVQRRAAEAGATLAYVNMVGGQDELVFDGDSIIVDAAGRAAGQGPAVRAGAGRRRPGPGARGRVAVPLGHPGRRARRLDDHDPPAGAARPGGRRGPADRPEPRTTWPRLSDPAEVYAALVLGVRDYVRKNGFGSVILALSGGIDSALTATIAADAVGPDRVHVVLMPSRYSSDHSVTDAEDLAKRQGLHARTVPIRSMVDAFEAELSLSGLAAENLQARIRGMILMSLSNAEGHLALTTGNKSELATGYSTLYGDSAGGFAPIKDVLKTLVWDLARWRNSQAESRGETPPIPENSITKPPSAELAPGQMDSDTLPDYPVLDAILEGYVEQDMGAAELVAAGHDPALVERVIRHGRPGRVQAPAVPAGPEDHAEELRQGPPPADHQPVA